MSLANYNGKEHLRHRAVSLRQHGFLVYLIIYSGLSSPLTSTMLSRHPPLNTAILNSVISTALQESTATYFNLLGWPYSVLAVAALTLAQMRRAWSAPWILNEKHKITRGLTMRIYTVKFCSLVRPAGVSVWLFNGLTNPYSLHVRTFLLHWSTVKQKCER